MFPSPSGLISLQFYVWFITVRERPVSRKQKEKVNVWSRAVAADKPGLPRGCQRQINFGITKAFFF